jgi:hypothetical protein
MGPVKIRVFSVVLLPTRTTCVGCIRFISLFFKLCRKVPAKVVPAPVVSKSKLPAVPESLLKRRKKQKADRTKRLEQALAVSVKSCFRVRHILTGRLSAFTVP